MVYVKYVMVLLALVATVLCFVYSLPAIGTQGYIVIGACAAPLVLGGAFSAMQRSLPRWASVVSALSFALAGMKTSGGDSDLQNIMVAAFFGMILAVVLAIRPDRSAGA